MCRIVVREYEGASFLNNLASQRSVFFEGPVACLAARFLSDTKYIVPESFLTQFPLEHRTCVLNDCADVREAALALLNEEKFLSTEPPLSMGSALKDLSAYAIRNWQVVNVNLELTYRCNQRCRPCYLEDFRQKGMSRARIASIAQELKQAGALFILLTGGEIFLRPDTMEIMEDLEGVGFILEVKTNGTLLHPGLIERMARLHLFDVQVSIYEIEPGYSEFTRTVYPIDIIERNVRFMLELGLPITLSVLVGKHNIDSIRRIHERLSSTGAEIFYSPYLTPNRGGAGQEISYRLSRAEMEEKFKPFLEEIDAFPTQDRYRNCATDSTVCFAGRDQIAIDPTGKVYPCLDLRFQLGDLARESLGEILARRQSILESFTLDEMPQCGTCGDREFCDSCIGLALIENGNYRIPSQHKCDVTQFYAHGRR